MEPGFGFALRNGRYKISISSMGLMRLREPKQLGKDGHPQNAPFLRWRNSMGVSHSGHLGGSRGKFKWSLHEGRPKVLLAVDFFEQTTHFILTHYNEKVF